VQKCILFIVIAWRENKIIVIVVVIVINSKMLN
jgi:hypothetical protein